MVQTSAPVDMVDIQYLQGLIHPRWCRMSSINNSNKNAAGIRFWAPSDLMNWTQKSSPKSFENSIFSAVRRQCYQANHHPNCILYTWQEANDRSICQKFHKADCFWPQDSLHFKCTSTVHQLEHKYWKHQLFYSDHPKTPVTTPYWLQRVNPRVTHNAKLPWEFAPSPSPCLTPNRFRLSPLGWFHTHRGVFPPGPPSDASSVVNVKRGASIWSDGKIEVQMSVAKWQFWEKFIRFANLIPKTMCHGNPQPSFFGVITHRLGVQNLHFSWFWGPRVGEV